MGHQPLTGCVAAGGLTVRGGPSRRRSAELAAVCSTDRHAAAPDPPSSGWEYWISGQRHVSPCAPRSTRRENGVSTASGWAGRALVVDQAGERQLAAARPAAERVGGLEHGHLDALGGEGEGGSEPVGPAADDDCTSHAVTSGCLVVVVTAGAWLTRM